MTRQLAAADVGGFAEKKRPVSTFTSRGEGCYRLEVRELGLRLDVDRLRRERNELIGELTVSLDWAGAATVDGTLSSADFNLSSARARQDRARLLQLRSHSKPEDVDWQALLETLCLRTIAAERAGQPAVLLRDVPRPSPDETFTVEGFPVLRRHPMMLFGDGGTAKSLLALYVAGSLVTRGWSVLYADWELSGEDHRERLERLFGPDMPAVQYARCARPLVHEADRLGRLVRQHGIDYVIADSVAFACDGPPEAAEVAGRYFMALRSLGVGSLNIAHVNKSDQGDQKPFGSTFWHNGARSTWFMKAGGTTPTGLSVGLFNRKANLGPLRLPIGYEIDFDLDTTTFRRIEVASVDDLAQNMPLWLRIKQAVRSRPLTLAALAEELNAKVDTIDKTTRRHCGVFTRVTGEDHVPRIALVTKEVA
jgi:AAA domain